VWERLGTSICVKGLVLEILEVGLEALIAPACGVDTERELPLDVMLDAEREGPSLDTTRADLSTKRLNSYFAVTTR
jgi:hypothetical protein